MFRSKGIVLIAGSLVLAIVAALVANRWVEARVASPGDQAATTPVVIAAIDIPFGTQVEARHLAVIQMLTGTAPRGSYPDTAKVVGKVSHASMLSGEVLLDARFSEHGNGSTLAAVVEKNMRAVSVRVDDVVGVGGFLLPGNRVDVVAARDLDRNQAVTETILQNIRVLAVDQTAATEKNEPVVVRAVTLEVTPEQAEVLLKGKEEGSILLTLRNPLDGDVQEKAKPAPVAATPKRRAVATVPGVTVIRGTEVAKHSLN